MRERFCFDPLAPFLGVILIFSFAWGQTSSPAAPSTRVLFQSKDSFIGTTKLALKKDGSLVACFSREFFGPPYDEWKLAPGEEFHKKSFITRSSDLGKTWSSW